MITEETFLQLVKDELALPLTETDMEDDFDRVVAWDSIQMLRLVAAVEKHTGKRAPLGKLLSARSLRGIYDLVAA